MITPLARPFILLTASLLASVSSAAGQLAEVQDEIGVGDLAIARLAAVDLNNDDHADLVLRPIAKEPAQPVVYLWIPDPALPVRGSFQRQEDSELPRLAEADVITFADVDNDGRKDAVVARYLDYLRDGYTPPVEPPARTAWLPGRGDGRFDAPREIGAALAGTTAAISVGDANRDGLPDLWLGNWYQHYLAGNEAFPNDLLLQYRVTEGEPEFARWSIPGETLPLDAATDPGGRPTYGTMIAQLDTGPLPALLELNYGRRWNRLYALERPRPLQPEENHPPRPTAPDGFAREEVLRTLHGRDIAPEAGFDGDAIRHGRHPDWLAERAKADPRFARDDEPPFRANGNTFDAAVGDIDNDGDFDVFVSTIIHAWAGDSSDRSRFLVNQLVESGHLTFTSPTALSVDRVPSTPTSEDFNYNQGDIFAGLVDFNNDGRLDLVICSSDYSDPPPHDERLRIYLQTTDGTFRDATAELGVDHIGAGQPALVDLDQDGAIDLVVGQSFNRLNAERRRAAGLANGSVPPDAPEDHPAEPRLHVYHNRSAGSNTGIVLRLRGDPAQGSARDAYGAIVHLRADLDGDPATPPVTLVRQLVGPGGHAGKTHDAFVHFGLGRAARATDVEIQWPNHARSVTSIQELTSGTYAIDQKHDDQVERLNR